MSRKKTLIFLVLLTLLSLTLFHGTFTASSQTGAKEERFENIGTVLEVIALVKTRHYFQPVNTFDLIKSYVAKGTINGMLKTALDDPYTRHMDAVAFENMMNTTTGIYGGIGLSVGILDDRVTVVSPIKGTPGERAGLRRGDKIIAINGKDTVFMTLDEAVSLMRGEENTELDLTIQRDEEIFEVHIVRELINVESVTEVEMIDEEYRIGYIQITNFSERTYRELVTALEALDAQQQKALILDLRNNPGGTLNAALQVTNEFVSGAPLLYLEDKEGNRTPFDSLSRGTRSPIPMVVLINGGSASASEIVSGALQDNNLATLVGTTTFGKGLVQSLYPLRDGSALTVTEQGYLTSGGKDINGVGIEPDITVEVSIEEEEAIYLGEAEFDPQLERGLEVLRAQL
ncbi:MAG TPA: S41 family peptidase [Firmicutes bacterium]|nr:S41 family peptidase [Bacillota bacterium]